MLQKKFSKKMAKSTGKQLWYSFFVKLLISCQAAYCLQKPLLRCFTVNLRNFSELHLHDIDKACSIVWKCFRLSFGVGNADGISSFPTQSTKNIKPIRSSCSQVYFKKDVLKNFAIFTGKRLCWSVFSIKLQVRKFATLLKRDSTQVFSWEI